MSQRLDDETLRWGYEQAAFSRSAILKCVNLTQSGQAKFWIGGPGEEVSGAAMALALHHVQPDGAKRSIHGHYRSDTVMLPLGNLAGWTGDRELAWKLFRQQLTRATDDMSLGRQMVNHWVVPELGIQPVSTPVGMQLGRAAGFARGFQAKGVDGTVNIGIVGDGSAAEGDTHDAMNAASVWRLPVVVCVTDNGVAIQTSPEAGRGIKDWESYARAFNVAYFDVNGFDFEEAYFGMKAAFEHCANEGPVFLHVRIPRLMGHSSAGDMAFRYDLPDPLLDMGAELVKRGILQDADIARRKPDAALKGSWHANHVLGSIIERSDARNNEIAKVVVAEPYPGPETAELHVRRPFPEVVEPEHPEEQTKLPYALAIRTALDRNLAGGKAVVWGQDVAKLGGVMSCTRGLATRYPERCVDSPLNEPLICGTAFGAGMHEDLWAFPEIQFGDYSLNCLHWFVLMGLWNWTTAGQSVPKVCLRTPVDPFRGGAVYHSMSLDGYYTPIPGLVIAVPSTTWDVYGFLRTASDYEGPVMVLEPKILYRQTKGPKLPGEPETINATRHMAGESIVEELEDFRVPFGKGVVRRPGDDVTIVAWGWAVHQALEAAEQLAAEGVSAEVIDLRTLVPYDKELVAASVEKTGRLLVAHPDRTYGSFGRQVQADVTEVRPGTPTLCVGMRNVPACTQCVELEDHIALQSPWISDAARALLGTEVLSSAGAAGASFVRADDPMAWVQYSSSLRQG